MNWKFWKARKTVTTITPVVWTIEVSGYGFSPTVRLLMKITYTWPKSEYTLEQAIEKTKETSIYGAYMKYKNNFDSRPIFVDQYSDKSCDIIDLTMFDRVNLAIVE